MAQWSIMSKIDTSASMDESLEILGVRFGIYISEDFSYRFGRASTGTIPNLSQR